MKKIIIILMLFLFPSFAYAATTQLAMFNVTDNDAGGGLSEGGVWFNVDTAVNIVGGNKSDYADCTELRLRSESDQILANGTFSGDQAIFNATYYLQPGVSYGLACVAHSQYTWPQLTGGKPYTQMFPDGSGSFTITGTYRDGQPNQNQTVAWIYNVRGMILEDAPIPGNKLQLTAVTNEYNETILEFNATVDGSLLTTTNGSIEVDLYQNSSVLHNITFFAVNHEDTPYMDYNVSDNLQGILNFSYYRLNITAVNALNGSDITVFTVTTNTSVTASTTNGGIILNLTKDAHFNVTIDPNGYAIDNATIIVNDSWIHHQFSIYTTNSISITVREASSSNIIVSNTSARFISDAMDETHYFVNGTFYIDELDPNEYTIQFHVLDTGLGYSDRSYTLTLSNRSHMNLNAYLESTNGTTTFTIRDADSDDYLEDVLSTMYRLIGGVWTAIESKTSDITGRVQFTYTPNTQYRFYLSRSDYEDSIFYLNPILFSDYNVYMTKIAVLNETPPYSMVSVVYSPYTFYDDQSNNFTFVIQSPLGELIDYGYTLTYPSGSYSASGSNAIGEQLQNNFTITGATNFDTVRLDYYYETSLTGRYDFTYNYAIVSDIGNYTMITLRETTPTYGLGIFERALIISCIVLGIVGIASLIGQVVPGMMLGLLIMGYFAYTGFVPVWLVLLPIFSGFMLAAMKGGG